MGLSRRPYVCGCVVGGCVHTFEHEYIWDQQANRNQILFEASMGLRKATLGFMPDQIRTLVSMATDSSHWVLIGEKGVSAFSPQFLMDPFNA